jgi:hypothetical protein
MRYEVIDYRGGMPGDTGVTSVRMACPRGLQ